MQRQKLERIDKWTETVLWLTAYALGMVGLIIMTGVVAVKFLNL